jgi:hypothetical protein
MKKIENKLGKNILLKQSVNEGNNSKTKLPTPKLGGGQFPFKMLYDLQKTNSFLEVSSKYIKIFLASLYARR